MAEEKTKNIYKYKGDDLDRDLLLKNLDHNVEGYIKHQGWDDSKIQEFRDAYDQYRDAIESGRISSGRYGELQDSAGILDNGSANYRDKNGNVLSEEAYNALKKRQKKGVTQNFYANREVASYINSLAGSLYDTVKNKEEEPAPKFDWKTNNLWSQFISSLNPAGSPDIEKWWDLDEYNEESKSRDTVNRANYLADFIDTYIGNLSEDLDFSETSFKNREAYLNRLKEIQTELRNGIQNIDYRNLDNLGSNPEEYNAFFTTDKAYNPNPTPEPEETPEEKKKKEEEAKAEERRAALENIWNERQTIAQGRNYKNHNRWSERLSVDQTKTDKKDKQKSFLDNWHNQNLPDIASFFATASADTAAPYLEQFNTYYGENFNTIENGKYANWKYLPGSFNRTYHSVLAYDPNTHNVRRIWMGDIPDTAVQAEYKQMLEDQYDIGQNSGNPFSLQSGGHISIKESSDSLSEVGKSSAERSAQTKADPKLRQLGKKGTDYSDNQLTKTDIARLSAIGADIAALIDPEPISALSLGVASDITNLVSDINEGYGFFNSAGNFLGNLGLSAVGMIPIFGDAVGSGGKVVKSLIKIAPKVTGTLIASGLLAGLSNSDEIIKSFKKIGKDGVENEMNMEDWRNIGLGIQLILGGANAAKNVRTVKTLKAAGKSNAVDVKVQNTKTGEPKVLRFGNKEVANQIKKAGSPEEVNAIINRYNSLNGRYEVATREVSTKSASSRWYKPWTWFRREATTAPVKNYATEAFDFNGVRRSYNRGNMGGFWNNRARYIASHEPSSWSNTPSTINSRPANAKPVRNEVATPKATEKPATTAAPKAATETAKNTSKLTSKEFTANARKARAYYNNQKGNISKKPHSPEGQRLIDSGVSEARLMAAKMWKEGGRISRARKIVKAAGGDNTINFNIPVSYDEEYEAWRRSHGTLPNIDLTGTNGRNYGSGYIARDLRYYNNKEYGVEGPVNISQIEISDPGTRSSNLSPAHRAEGYDYTNAQLNTDNARAAWQKDASNRLNDFANWARAWYKENPEGTQSQMLAAYNNAIDSMYKFKREMGKDYTGDKSYRKDSKVGEFNRTNKAIYGSANTPVSGVHGYDVNSEDVNGTTTAQRFIDITDEDLSNLDWNSIFNENDSEKFRNLFTGLSKDKTGRYYVEVAKPVASSPEITQSSPEVVKPTSETNPVISEDSNDDNNSKTPFDWQSIYTGIAPETLAIGRYLATRNFDKNLLNIAKNMPVMLYNPNERLRWVKGDNSAIQEGEQAAGQLNHLAQQAVSADAAQQQAAAMEGLIKGRAYIDQGYATNSKAEDTSREANWQQEGENQTSRYNIAMKDRENLFNHRVNYLESLGNYKRAIDESLNQLLSQFENKTGEAREKQQTLQESLEKENIKNTVLNNPNAYGLNLTEEDQRLLDNINSGKVQFSKLSTEEQNRYYQIDNQLSDKILELYAKSRGANYIPYKSRFGNTTNYSYDIQLARQGGAIEGDSEKVTIQKLRAKVQKMAIRQRQLETRLNAYEKDMDRAQRSASQYVKSQKRSK